MRVLYHFRGSPFSRRVRLALAHKGLEVELRESRDKPEFMAEAKQRSPFVTVPALVEEDGRALGDSSAIVAYLDRAYPDLPGHAPLWPSSGADAFVAFELAALVTDALDTMVAAGNRFHALAGSEAWETVRATEVARVHRALGAIAERVERLERPTVLAGGWSAVDMWIYTAAAWWRGLPARAATFKVARQLVSLGVEIPAGIERWADQHAQRPDVLALDQS